MSETNESGAAGAELGEPLVLVLRGSDPDKAVAFACGKCRIVAPDEEAARQCCAPWLCSTCGNETGRRYVRTCDDCRIATQRANERVKEAARLAAATVVPWEDVRDTMLYDEEHDRWLDAGEYPDEADEDAPTRYAYVGVPQCWRPSTDHFLDQLADGDWHEDAAESVSAADVAELDAFLAAWSERVNVVSYFPDFKRIVVFDPAAIARPLSTPSVSAR